MSYARQLPEKSSSILEHCAREFNYPDCSLIKSENDLQSMGIKAFFASNVCAAYDRSVYEKLGGFVEHTIFNEDMIYARGLIGKGYGIAYVAEAKVYHSHNYSGIEQFRRYFDLGVSHAQYPAVFGGIKSESEGSGQLSAKEKSIIDRCTAQVYHDYIRSGYRGTVPTLQDFHAQLLNQPEPEARDVALAIELFTEGSLNTFAKPTNVDTNSRILCYDIRDLGKQLLPVGMLVVLDSIFNRVIRNRSAGKNTWIYIDEIYLLFQHEYSANFLFTLWKRVRKYGACASGLAECVQGMS